MSKRQRWSFTLSAAAFALAALSPGVHAQANYPSKPVRIIVPFAPGGSTDIIARLVGDRMGKELGQPFVIENKGGAGGAIGATEAARAKPDGYTLSIATVSTLAVVPACTPDLGYDPIKSFQPVTNFAHTANVLAVNPKVEVADIKDFIEKAKAEPGKFSFASSGVCSILHYIGELFQDGSGTKMVHIPYRGSGPAIADVVAGQVPVIFDNLPSSMPHIQAGKLKPLAVAWHSRIESLPNVPTFAEVGIPQANDPAWYGLLAPAGTPPEVVKVLRDAAAKVLKEQAVIDTLNKQGASPVGNTPEEFAEEIRKEFEKARDVVKKAGITLK